MYEVTFIKLCDILLITRHNKTRVPRIRLPMTNFEPRHGVGQKESSSHEESTGSVAQQPQVEIKAPFDVRAPDPRLAAESLPLRIQPSSIEDSLTRVDSALRKDQVSTEIERGSSALNRITQVVKAVVTSNNSYASIGNCLLTSSLWTGLFFHPLCSILAVRNEMAESRRKNGLSTTEENYVPGLRQEILDLSRSPGVYR